MTQASTTPQFTIGQMRVADARTAPSGNRLIATFDMEFADVKIIGCVLIRRADGSLTADGPRGKAQSGHKTNVDFRTPELRRAVTSRASALLEAFTGTAAGAD